MIPKPTPLLRGQRQATPIEVKTREYEFSHGHAPRGKGNWAFQIGTVTFWHTGTYGDAKKAAITAARQADCSIVAVLP